MRQGGKKEREVMNLNIHREGDDQIYTGIVILWEYYSGIKKGSDRLNKQTNMEKTAHYIQYNDIYIFLKASLNRCKIPRTSSERTHFKLLTEITCEREWDMERLKENCNCLC